jgi:hypothetical protein
VHSAGDGAGAQLDHHLQSIGGAAGARRRDAHQVQPVIARRLGLKVKRELAVARARTQHDAVTLLDVVAADGGDARSGETDRKVLVVDGAARARCHRRAVALALRSRSRCYSRCAIPPPDTGRGGGAAFLGEQKVAATDADVAARPATRMRCERFNAGASTRDRLDRRDDDWRRLAQLGCKRERHATAAAERPHDATLRALDERVDRRRKRRPHGELLHRVAIEHNHAALDGAGPHLAAALQRRQARERLRRVDHALAQKERRHRAIARRLVLGRDAVVWQR